jgi:hypothetical protein
VERLQAAGNVSAQTLRAKELVANDLANNIAHAFRWHDATTILKELGCSLFLEMPPDTFRAISPPKTSLASIQFRSTLRCCPGSYGLSREEEVNSY